MQAKTYETEFTCQTRVFFSWGLSLIFCAYPSRSLQRILFEIRLLFQGQKTHIWYTTCSSMNLFYQSFRYLLCCYKICFAGCFHYDDQFGEKSQRKSVQDRTYQTQSRARLGFYFLSWGLRILFEIGLLYRGQKTQISYTTCCSIILFNQTWERLAYLPKHIPEYWFKKLRYWICIYSFYSLNIQYN